MWEGKWEMYWHFNACNCFPYMYSCVFKQWLYFPAVLGIAVWNSAIIPQLWIHIMYLCYFEWSFKFDGRFSLASALSGQADFTLATGLDVWGDRFHKNKRECGLLVYSGVKSNADITCIEKTFHSYPDCVGHDFQAFSRLQDNVGHLLCATHSSNIWLNE